MTGANATQNPQRISELWLYAHVLDTRGLPMGMDYWLHGRSEDPFPVPQSRNISVRQRTAPGYYNCTERRYNACNLSACFGRGRPTPIGKRCGFLGTDTIARAPSESWMRHLIISGEFVLQ